MANSIKEPPNTTEIKQRQNMEQIAKPKLKSNLTASKNNFLLPSLAFIIALGALATSLYTLSLNQQLQKRLADKGKLFSTQIDKLEQKEDKIQDQVMAKNHDIEEARTVMQTKFDELNKQLQSAINQRFYQNQNWLLLKARYYLELAQINAHWSKSFRSTIALLQQTDQLLNQLSEPKIFEIRQAISQDIAKLQASPQIDVAGVLSQLDAAQNSLNDLSSSSILSKPTAKENLDTAKANNSIWRLHFQDSMKLLSKLVVIRRNDENITPLISPAFESILKENIRLNLQEAQWAVLNNNTQVYHLVLNQALTSLKKNFNGDAQNTAALIKKLGELEQIKLNPKRPAADSALPLLNQLIESKEAISNQSSTNKLGDSQ